MKVFITGSESGQLFWELQRTVPDTVTLVSSSERVDITDAQSLDEVLQDLRPDVVINAAAYTAVDKAESDEEQALAVNGKAIEHLCTSCLEINANLVHVSTDFVFGASNGMPFLTDSATSPVSVYGSTKLAGENVLKTRMPDSALCIRTAWVYSSHGSNFVLTMLRLMQERGEVGVIADQVGSPTWAYSLARAIWVAVANRSVGMMHWTGAGVASWYDFAVAIAEEAYSLGILKSKAVVNPLTTSQYPTPATRPTYSVLELTSTWDRLDYRASHWREDLRAMLKELK